MTQISGITNHVAPAEVFDRSARGVSKDSHPAPAAGVRSQDGASLSTAASLLASPTTSSTTDDVRTEKVASVKAAIAAGSYAVSAGEVADKLIAALQGGR